MYAVSRTNFTITFSVTYLKNSERQTDTDTRRLFLISFQELNVGHLYLLMLCEAVLTAPQCRVVYFCCWRDVFVMWEAEGSLFCCTVKFLTKFNCKPHWEMLALQDGSVGSRRFRRWRNCLFVRVKSCYFIAYLHTCYLVFHADALHVWVTAVDIELAEFSFKLILIEWLVCPVFWTWPHSQGVLNITGVLSPRLSFTR